MANNPDPSMDPLITAWLAARGLEYGLNEDAMDGYEADTETDSEAGVNDENQSLLINENATADQDDEQQQQKEENITEQNLPKQLGGLTIRDNNKGKLAIYTREEAAKFLAKSTGKKQGFIDWGTSEFPKIARANCPEQDVFNHFTRLPREVRDHIYAVHLESADPVYGTTKSNVLNAIYTPAICQTNRQLRAETLPLYLSMMRWCICANAPLPIGEISISNGLPGLSCGMGFGLGHGSFPGNYDYDGAPPVYKHLEWTRDQLFVDDDIEDGIWANWCHSLERLGRAAENGVRQFRIVCYAHKLLRRKTPGSIVYLAATGEPFEGFRRQNDYGLLFWDIDLIDAPGRRKLSMVQIIADYDWFEVHTAECVLEGLVSELRQKKLQGELRAHDVKNMVEVFAKYIEEMGMDPETKELRAIRF